MRIGLLFAVLLLVDFQNAHSEGKGESAYPQLAPIVENLGPGCRVRFDGPVRAARFSNLPGFDSDGKKNESWVNGSIGFVMRGLPHWDGDWSFGLSCYPSNDTKGIDGVAKYDLERKRWVINSSVNEGIKDANIKFLSVEARNAQGWMFVHDDVAIDESKRCRHVQYCLYHGDRALCGEADVGCLKDISRHTSADRTPYVKKMLSSVEFLLDAEPSGDVGDNR